MCHEENSVSVYFPPISNLINLCTDVNPEENCVYTIPTTSLRTYLGVLTCPTCPLMNQCGSVDVYPGEYCVNLPYLSTKEPVLTCPTCPRITNVGAWTCILRSIVLTFPTCPLKNLRVPLRSIVLTFPTCPPKNLRVPMRSIVLTC